MIPDKCYEYYILSLDLCLLDFFEISLYGYKMHSRPESGGLEARRSYFGVPNCMESEDFEQQMLVGTRLELSAPEYRILGLTAYFFNLSI